MKFLHLSTGDVRGAFTGAHRLHENLRAAGHESMMFVLQKNSSDPDVFAPFSSRRIISAPLSRYILPILKRIICKRYEFKKRYFFPYFSLIDLEKTLFKQLPFRPDVIVVNYIADFLSIRDLLTIQTHYRAPLVFYLMDAGLLTGACHYPWDCRGYENECGHCPIFRRSGSTDWSNMMWRERRSVFSQANYSIVAGSSWLLDMALKSSLHRGRRIEKILLGVNSDLFRPRSKNLARATLGLQLEDADMVVYFGAQMLEDPRKGFAILFSALEKMQHLLEEHIIKRIVLFTVGAQRPDKIDQLMFRNIHLEYIENKESFAMTYNAADIFICPSIEDAGPMMINESMMSGTPVIAFKMGVAEDLIIDGETGFIAREIDSGSLAARIGEFLQLPEQTRLEMSLKCREKAQFLTSHDAQVRNFLDLCATLESKNAQG